jgi:hypothetical protein
MRLPSPDRLKDPEVREYMRQLVQAIERQFAKHPEKPFTKDRVKITGVTKQYAFDCTAGTLADVRQVLGTLIVDIQDAGVLP